MKILLNVSLCTQEINSSKDQILPLAGYYNKDRYNQERETSSVPPRATLTGLDNTLSHIQRCLNLQYYLSVIKDINSGTDHTPAAL